MRLATVTASQAVGVLVMTSPVKGDCPAGNPVHSGFGEGFVSVVSLHIGKGHYYIVEYVSLVLFPDLAGKSGSYPVVSKILAGEPVVSVAGHGLFSLLS